MTPTPADDARGWAAVYLHGARTALDAAEASTGLQRALNLATAERQIGLAIMKRVLAKDAPE